MEIFTAWPASLGTWVLIGMNEVGNSQRALWMVLITSLAAPLIAALALTVALVVASAAGANLPAVAQGGGGETAVAGFVWASFPATVAAFALVPFVLQHGTYGWLHAAIAGVVACAAAAVIFPLNVGGLLPVIAFSGGLIAVGMRTMLIGFGVLKP